MNELLGRIVLGGYLFSVAIDQTKKYLFLNQYSGGLKIVDISDIQSPNVLGVYESIGMWLHYCAVWLRVK